MKGLIPAAGKGTRLEPITLAIPKELLLVGDKAVIEHVIEAMTSVGITEITVVVGWKKHAILDYLGSGERLGVKLTYVVQDKSDGLARAVLTGEHVVRDDSFIAVLGDDFFYPRTFLSAILAFHEARHADATIGVARIDEPERHGIIKPGTDFVIEDIVEKPDRASAPSDLGCMGVYVFTSAIFDAIRKTKPGVNGEYQLTDSIRVLLDEGYTVLYHELAGTHIDVGTIEDLKKANAFFSRL